MEEGRTEERRESKKKKNEERRSITYTFNWDVSFERIKRRDSEILTRAEPFSFRSGQLKL
jgi:hypothetical protein